MSSGGARHLLALLAIAAAIVAVYANGLGGGFVLDSRALVLENPWVHAATWTNVRALLTHDYWEPFATGGLYRPLTTLSYLANHAVLGNGDRPFGYHATNLALHLACVGLVYALVWHLAGRQRPAVVAAALFGLHPVATEAVTYVVGRADLLAALGVLGGLLCHVRGSADPRHRAPWLLGLVVSATVAVFSKETGVVLLPLMAAYDLLVRSRRGTASTRGLVTDYVAAGCVAGAYLTTRWAVATAGLPPPDVSPVDNPLVEGSFWTARLTALGVIGRELGLLVFPLTLSADYSYRRIPLVAFPPRTVGEGVPLVAVAGLVLALVFTWRARRVSSAVPFLVAFSALALLPASNLVVLIGTIMGERLLYLPLVGFAGAAGLLVCGSRRAGAVSTALVAAVLVACACRTWARNRDWADELRLWTATVHAAPESAKARKAYAAALYAADRDHSRLDRVIPEAERAVAIRPDYLDALSDLGSYYVVAGERAGEPVAQAWYARAVDVLERGRMLDVAVARRFREKMEASGRPPDALPDTGSPFLYNNLALAYAHRGRLEDARTAYERVRALEPLDPSHYVDLSSVLCRLGRWQECAVTLFEALAIAPDHHDAAGRVVQVYRVFDADGHAIAEDRSGHLQVNLDDAMVHDHRCRAARELTTILRRARQLDPAASARRREERWCGKEDSG